jgi:hypothetical protein
MDLTEKQLAKLKEIGGVPEGSYFAQPIAVNALVKLGLVEQHPTAVNPENAKEKATRLTDLGKQQIGQKLQGETTEVEGFTIVKLARPAQGRTLDSSAYKYPFDKLGNGEAFFVPAKADVKSPAKAFASTLATANNRFKTKDDFRRFSTRSMLGDAFGEAYKGQKGVGVFRLEADEEAAAKAEAAKDGWK